MLKRIFAWILLVGFVLFIINFIFLGYYRQQSIVVYLAIVVVYFIINSQKKRNKDSSK